MQLWNREYPASLAYDSIESFDAYISSLIDARHVLIQSKEGIIQGWYFDFLRDGNRNFGMLLDARIQGAGVGSELLRRSKVSNSELHGWAVESSKYKKMDGTFYKSPIDFYRKNGFEIIPEVQFTTEQLTAIKIQWTL
ncbi:MAG: GNAT superfamily N-acetyltransferase [Crocinitomicaceae bacterium]|jgi:GNAT superfamily N-acetyltransferase